VNLDVCNEIDFAHLDLECAHERIEHVELAL
jgi:hypothetical protein